MRCYIIEWMEREARGLVVWKRRSEWREPVTVKRVLGGQRDEG